jgi:hypothetical protein
MQEESARPRRLSGTARKAFLVTHIVAAGAWIGVDVVLAVLVFTAMLADDTAVAATSYQALQLFAVWPLLIAGLVCLASGVVLGLGSTVSIVTNPTGSHGDPPGVGRLPVDHGRPTFGRIGKNGLVRYWWVAGKLVLNILLTTLGVLALRPGVNEAVLYGRRLATGEATGPVPDLIFPPIVSPACLLLAVVLSVAKPWGRIRPTSGSAAGKPLPGGRGDAPGAGRLTP